MSKKGLQNFDGKDGRPAYIAYNGSVYDVTDNLYWTDGNHLESHFAGVDLTAELGDAPHGAEIFEGVKKIGVLED
ncbi:MAG: cytochrome B5 [Deltaproteobacteria bacterium]|nr:cytochrome B5 [Deltaproteobacteria bacterium]